MKEIDGIIYYTEEEVRDMRERRRASDKITENSLHKFHESLQKFEDYGRLISDLKQIVEHYKRDIDRHDEILRGGQSSEGLCTTTAKVVSTVSAVANDVWDKEKGLGAINAKLDVIMEKKKDYDSNLSDTTQLKVQVAGYGLASGGISGVIVVVLEKVFHIFGKN